MKTKVTPDGTGGQGMLAEWWKAESEDQLAKELIDTAAYLKSNQQWRIRQISADIRLYAGLPIYNYAGANISRMDRTRTLPQDRPTFNLVAAVTDTLVSRVGQNKPEPKFLTDGGDYRERHLAQELNQFTQGEFYRTHAYIKARRMFRDGVATGASALKVYEGEDDKVSVDRVLQADLYVDDNDALNGQPQQLLQLKLVDRDKFMARYAKHEKLIAETPSSLPDNSADSGRTTTDQILVVEGWRLPSGEDPEAPGYIPGRHTIATSQGIVFDDKKWQKTRFPFVFFNYSDPFLGFWGKGIATRLFGTQMTLNRILNTISQAIQLVGVPRVFIDQSSKVVKSHQSNDIGVLITYAGTKPSYEIAPCNAPELYSERDKLIEYGFRQEGVSDMQSTSEKPAGLNSGEAIRSYDDVNSDRFAETSAKYDQVFIDLAYLITETAMDICKRTGKYTTVYPNKDGTKEIDLPKMTLLKNPYIIQCFNESSLPRTPAGRIATVTEQIQAGMLTIKEGRRLLHFPDLEQNEKLDNASEERIFQILDKIVEKGNYTPPDSFMDLQLATQLTVQYLNLYLAAKLEEEKADLLRKFFVQVQAMIQGAQPVAQPPQAPPQAVPQPPPTSPLLPNAPNAPQAS